MHTVSYILVNTILEKCFNFSELSLKYYQVSCNQYALTRDICWSILYTFKGTVALRTLENVTHRPLICQNLII